MPNRPRFKNVHLQLDPALTRYWVSSEVDAWRASTDEEEDQVKKTAYQQIDEAIQPYLLEGWVVDGPYDQAVTLERRIVLKEGSLFRGHTHFAAVVAAKVRLRR